LLVVDPEVSRRKFDREVDLWSGQEEAYRRRGWVMLSRGELAVDIGFLGRLPVAGAVIPAMTACVRVDFTNFDVWAPSVEFIDPFTGDYALPTVQAIVASDEGPRDLIVQGHPATGRPFFCVPGVRQYHDHPQHSGDSWLLHRESGEGSLATICDRLWRSMARNLIGVQVNVQTLPGQLQVQLRVANAPEEVVEAMWAHAREAEHAAHAALAVPAPQPLPSPAAAALGLVSTGPKEAS
jgi:hypothetical protein